LDGCCRFAPEAGMESDSKEEKRSEEGDRGGHGQTTGRSAAEEEYVGQSVQKHINKDNILIQNLWVIVLVGPSNFPVPFLLSFQSTM